MYSQSSPKWSPREFDKTAVTRAGRLQGYTLVSDPMVKQYSEDICLQTLTPFSLTRAKLLARVVGRRSFDLVKSFTRFSVGVGTRIFFFKLNSEAFSWYPNFPSGFRMKSSIYVKRQSFEVSESLFANHKYCVTVLLRSPGHWYLRYIRKSLIIHKEITTETLVQWVFLYLIKTRLNFTFRLTISTVCVFLEALIYMFHYQAIDNKCVAVLVLLDLSAAFDTIRSP